MKLLKYFGIASLAIAAPDERVFSDNDNFLNEKHDWWTDETTVEQMDLMKQLTPGVIRHYFKSVPALKENFLKRFEKLTRNMESHNERCERKNASGRKRRDANDEERFLMAGITSPHQDFWTVVRGHARWVTHTYLDDCPLQAHRILRRVDRTHNYMMYQYCKRIDDSPKFCPRALFHNGNDRPHPNYWPNFRPGGKYSQNFNEA